jgi:hypothetical protein
MNKPIVIALALFIFLVPSAHAASLTSSQVSAIIGILQAFGADQAVIDKVRIALARTSVPNPVPNPIPSPAPVPADLCVQQGLNNTRQPLTGTGGVSQVIHIKKNQSYSYAFTVPETGMGGQVLTQYSNVHLALSVSKNACDFSPSLASGHCYAASESPGLFFSSYTMNYAALYSCVVSPGQTYYLNIRETDGCPSGDCSFYLRY